MVAFRDIFKYLKISSNTQETYLEISPNDLEISLNTGALTISSNRFKDISKYTSDLFRDIPNDLDISPNGSI